MSTEQLEQAIASTRSVLTSITPDQLGQASPCASWKVSDVINHVVGAQFFFASSVAGEPPAGGEAPDFSAGDFVASFDQGTAASVAAFSAPGAMERIVKMPFGDLPGAMLMGIAAADTFTHGWDLAKATGQSTDLDPALVGQLLPMLKMAIQDAFRGPDGQAPFGAAQTAPAGCTPADEMAAFLGRTV